LRVGLAQGADMTDLFLTGLAFPVMVSGELRHPPSTAGQERNLP
jgi:hypothetical protein